MKRAMILFTLLFCFCFGFPSILSRAEIVGTVPTGLLVLEKKHPYYLFVPPEYSVERKWPLVFVIGNSGEDPKKTIEAWIDWAKENQFLVLVPSIFPREGSLPDELNRWLLRVKEEVTQRYSVDKPQVLLVGVDSGAHYAAYLGTRFPGEFAAAALIRQAWAGPLEKLIRPSTDREEQIAFYVAVNPQEKGFSSLEAKTLEFEKKGYSITFDPLKADEDFSKLQERMLAWFRQDVSARIEMRKRPRTTLKEKFKGFMKDFTEV